MNTALLVVIAALVVFGAGCTAAMLRRDKPHLGMLGMAALVVDAILAVVYTAVTY